MDANKIVERVRSLLVTPSQEWEVIKAETPTVVEIFTRYVMILAAIPAVASFLGWSVLGYSMDGTTYRVPIAAGLANAVITYVLTLASVYAMALIIDFVSPHFQGEGDFKQALKVAAYFPTSWWLAGIFSIFPALAILSVVGGLHSLWILWTGLGSLMEIPEDRRANYTGIIVLAAIVLTIVMLVVGMPLATPSRKL